MEDLTKFKEEMTFLQGCCLVHPEDYKIDLIAEVELWVQSVPDEEEGYALFKLTDGRYGVLKEGQDYTGHG